MLNKAVLIGRVGQEPETRYLPDGTAVTSISIATSEKWNDRNTGETKEETTWHKVVAFGKLAEIITEYVKKGALLYVEGKIVMRKYQDREGRDRVAFEIRANEMKMLGGKPSNGSEQYGQKSTVASSSLPPEFDSDIPF